MSPLINRLAISVGIIVGILSLCLAFFSSTTLAVTGSDWRAGNIISDGLFYRTSDLSPSSIQSFLNSRVPNCDTAGSKPYAGTTRAAYGASKGNPAPYICLKNYSMNTQGKSANSYCSSIGGGNKSAATIIYEVSNACGISAKALIVMLEKEQGLVTDDWPWNIQYRGAMGYGCPDGAPCDAEYYGFFNQVYNAARQFKLYASNQNSYRHKAQQNNFIYWNPETAACGGSSVYIQNKATAGLYNYTPYQPNQAALNNLYGSGDSCSAYGNRNFWRLHNDWFGSTQSSWPSLTKPRIFITNKATSKINPSTGQSVQSLSAGQMIRFSSKQGDCLRTEVDTNHNANACVKISNLDELSSIAEDINNDGSVSKKASLQWTCKVDYTTLGATDQCFKSSTTISFKKIVTVFGNDYIITKHDADRGITTGFPTNRFGPWLPLTKPRIFITNKATSKINPSTGQSVQSLSAGQTIRFRTKQGDCLRTEVDTNNNVNACVKINNLNELTSIVENINNDGTTSKKASQQWTCKIDYTTLQATNQCFESSTDIVFKKVITVFGNDYLITKHDADRGLVTGFRADRFSD